MPNILTKEWCVIYTKSRCEKKVCCQLAARGIEAYCPLNQVIHQWSDRAKAVEVPLFTSYLFVNIAPGEVPAVRCTAGVVNFTYWLGHIAKIRAQAMRKLQQFVTGHSNISIERLNYRKGDILQLHTGPFKGLAAVVKGIHKDRLELMLDSMNIKLVVSPQPALATH